MKAKQLMIGSVFRIASTFLTLPSLRQSAISTGEVETSLEQQAPGCMIVSRQALCQSLENSAIIGSRPGPSQQISTRLWPAPGHHHAVCALQYNRPVSTMILWKTILPNRSSDSPNPFQAASLSGTLRVKSPTIEGRASTSIVPMQPTTTSSHSEATHAVSQQSMIIAAWP